MAAVSLLLHVALAPVLRGLVPAGPLAPPDTDAPVNVTFLDGDPFADAPHTAPTPESPPTPETPPEKRRQLVETAPTEEQERPKDADYYAEQDRSVDVETRTERTRMNPDVLASRYADADQRPSLAAADVGATENGAGATAGAAPLSDARGKGPPRTRIPSRFLATNLPGTGAPALASADTLTGAGAPQNDLLLVKVGEELALNTLALPGARWFNGVRRHVNFYYSQNVDNFPRTAGLAAPVYETALRVTLDGSGAIEAISLLRGSGSALADAAAVRAFELAGPFPAPPPELVEEGHVRLPDFLFTLQVDRVGMR